MPRVRNAQAFASRRNEILSEAARVFRERGYHETTMEALAEELGQTKAAIYHYFESKDELLLEICERATVLALESAVTLEKEPLSPAVKFETIVRAHLREVAENLDAFTVFLQELWRTDHPRARALRATQRELQELIERLIVEGQADGTIRPLDPRIVTYAVLGLSHGAHEWMTKTGASTEDIADTVATMICGGVLMPEPAPRVNQRR